MSQFLRERLQSSLGSAYTIEAELGGGGMSNVFLATDRALGRRAVIKVLRSDVAIDLSAERFAREIRLAARLQQANIVPVLAAGTADGLPYYTMPFVDGASLRERIEAGRVPAAEAIGILRDVARALAYAHAHAVVHRDVKPENVLLSGGTAMVTDFGIAKALDAARTVAEESHATVLTRVGMSVGTPAYMAPEQAAGEDVDARADVYSWGLMAHELLAGAHPFAGKRSAAELIAAQLTEKPAPLRVQDVSQSVAALVQQCLAKPPGERPSDAGALLTALDRALGPEWSISANADLGGRKAQRRSSIVVLPFDNLSAEAENQYLADGIAEEITNALAGLKDLRVVSRTSAYAFRGKAEDVRVVGEKLNVDTVLEGSVRRAGDRLRVAAQLVDTSDGCQLWNARYDRDLTDIFAVQDEIATSIANTLEVALGSRSGKMVKPPTEDVEAFRLYHQGFELLMRRGRASIDAAQWFERAIARDERFAQAHAGLAEALAAATYWGGARPLDIAVRARAAANRAMELAPDAAESHVAATFLATYIDWDMKRAAQAATRALQLGPHETRARAAHAFHVLCMGQCRYDDAVREADRMLENDPLSAYAWSMAAHIRIASRREVDAALERAAHAVALDSNSFVASLSLMNAHLALGHHEAALDAAQNTLRISGRHPRALSTCATLHHHLGRDDAAHAVLDELRARARQEYVSHVDLARAAAGAGCLDDAFGFLDRAFEERDSRLLDIASDHLGDWLPLRDDPRVANVVRRVGWRRCAEIDPVWTS